VAADDTGERTERPTPRRRQEAREQGRVPRSTDLTAAIGLLAGVVLLNILGPHMFGNLLELARGVGSAHDTSTTTLTTWIARAVYTAGAVVLPFILALLLLTVAGGMAQSGAVFAWSRLTPKLDKLNPVAGVKRLFALDSLTRTGMGVLKIVLIGAVAYYSVIGEIRLVLAAGMIPPRGVMDLAAHVLFTLTLRLTLVLLILGLLDYFYQRWQVERGLKMTKQEVKDELKRMEGDPLVKRRRREVQARIAMQRIRIDVPKADVVVTNPSEYAVALRYDEALMAAPRVIAKGRDWLALRIRQVAQQYGVPIVQRPPLARALYTTVDVGQEVPAQFYRAIAELLAYVYQLSGRRAV